MDTLSPDYHQLVGPNSDWGIANVDLDVKNRTLTAGRKRPSAARTFLVRYRDYHENLRSTLTDDSHETKLHKSAAKISDLCIFKKPVNSPWYNEVSRRSLYGRISCCISFAKAGTNKPSKNFKTPASTLDWLRWFALSISFLSPAVSET
jgi:hypothetical protein